MAAGHAPGLSERRLGDEPRARNDDWSARHRQFHLSIYAACSSPLLIDLTDVLFDNAGRYRRWAARHRQSPRRKHDEHQPLLAAVTARHTDKAVALLRTHIARTAQLVAAALQAQAGAAQAARTDWRLRQTTCRGLRARRPFKPTRAAARRRT